VAVALVVALVAVPVLLSSSPAATPSNPQTSQALPVHNAHTGPAVTLEANAAQAALNGGARDPFTQQQLAGGGSASASAAAAGAAPSTSAVTATGGIQSTSAARSSDAARTTASWSETSTAWAVSGGGATAGAPGLPAGWPAPGRGTPTGTSHPAPPPTGLTPTEAYRVTLALSDSSGGFYTIDSVQRLSILPSAQPRLVELGVLQGGARVVFAVLPGTKLRGPGICIPGSLDCEFLSLAPGQTEVVSAAGSSPVLVAVTGVSVDRYDTAAAAQRVRQSASAAGARLLNSTTSQNVPLFEYDPSLGAVVDLRNLTVGGN
jgi:hypothetical protein